MKHATKSSKTTTSSDAAQKPRASHRKSQRQPTKANRYLSRYKDSLDTANDACRLMRIQIMMMEGISGSNKHHLLAALEALSSQMCSAWSKLQHERLMNKSRSFAHA